MASLLPFLLLLVAAVIITAVTAKQTYIVHLKHQNIPHRQWLLNHLLSLSDSDSDSDSDTDSFLYSYSAAYNGFAAVLTVSEAESLRGSPAVLGVYEDTVYDLHTTRTPKFLGLGSFEAEQASLGHNRQLSSDVIIGVLDTGVFPESPSFLDSGLPPVPSRWKGECETGPDFSPKSCNRKLVGARSFSRGYRMSAVSGGEPDSPRDHDGHGTHTASTAAGAHAANASLLGYARGMARGMAVSARVAAYKVCWKSGCFGSDILAGIEKALEDGVDVLSMSLGGGSAPYYRDTIAIGAFSAVERGVFVSCSAGNSGPARSSLANLAPWIMTVGAGTLDRDFPAYADLGNKLKITGVSLYSGKGMGKNPVELVYFTGTNVNGSSNLCLAGTLDPRLVKGKVVLCDRGKTARVEKGAVVRDAGGVGMILANTPASGEELVADAHLLPAVAVGRREGDRVRDYVRSEKQPTALLSFGGTVLGVRPSPVVAAFSSRGPNMVTPEILKPDLIGPGVNILAAWSESVGPTGLEQDTRKTLFNIMSGTSMSCPHISGLAALLKAAHPDWSPSAIKSALMTTAYTLDNTNSSLRDAAEGSLSTPFAHGSGHVDPHKAISPGLVYDLTTNDYIAFLCSLRYTNDHIQTIVKHSNFSCSRKFSNPGQLNYPSFSVVFGRKRVVRYTRVLTNVGAAGSAYDVAVSGPASVVVKVKPAKLVFGKVGDKLAYTVTFVSKKGGNNGTSVDAFGSLTWSNTEHQVRSPIAYAWAMV